MKNVQLKLNMEKYSQAKWFFFFVNPQVVESKFHSEM